MHGRHITREGDEARRMGQLLLVVRAASTLWLVSSITTRDTVGATGERSEQDMLVAVSSEHYSFRRASASVRANAIKGRQLQARAALLASVAHGGGVRSKCMSIALSGYLPKPFALCARSVVGVGCCVAER